MDAFIQEVCGGRVRKLPLKKIRQIAILGSLSLMLADCNRNPTATEEQRSKTSPDYQKPLPGLPLTRDVSAIKNNEQPVAMVSSVSLRRTGPERLVIRVSGIVRSGGWTHPRLVPVDDAKGEATDKIYKFVAVPPDLAEKTTANRINGQVEVDGITAEVKRIRVIAATNALSANLASR